MKILKARLLARIEEEQQAKVSEDRRTQVGSGARSERVRTYNFPQNRVTDHRINLTLYKLEDIMEGKLDELFDPLALHFQAEAISQAAAN
jgi:peptide chain release factor 1